MLKLSKVLRLDIIDVKGRSSENIYVAGKRKDTMNLRQDEPQFTIKIGGFLSSSHSPLTIIHLFCKFFLISPHVRLNSRF
jgi:hypothetical protein